MSKAVLISIRPEWCAKIANGGKTIEIRKTSPKLDTPFKCYIYCTKPSRSKMWRANGCMCFNDDEFYRDTKGKIKYGCSIELMACDDYSADNFLNGKVIGEFVCDGIAEIKYEEYDAVDDAPEEGFYQWWDAPGDWPLQINSGACLTHEQWQNYLGAKGGYAWHISNLKIYDEPKPLSGFYKPIGSDCCKKCGYWEQEKCFHTAEAPPVKHCKITRPPQSWCYVEELP